MTVVIGMTVGVTEIRRVIRMAMMTAEVRIRRDPSTGGGGLGGYGGYAGPDLDGWFFERLEWGGGDSVSAVAVNAVTAAAAAAGCTAIVGAVAVGEVGGDG